MDKAHVFALLEYVKVFQPIGTDDLTVRAWHLALDADMKLEWARDRMCRHFGNDSTRLAPADFNRWWRDAKERAYWQDNGAKSIARWDQDIAEMRDIQADPVHQARVQKYADLMRASVADARAGKPWPEERFTCEMEAIRQEFGS